MTARTLAHSLGVLLVVLTAACGGGGSSSSSSSTPTPAPSPTPVPVVMTATATVGGQSMTILVDAKGMTLYRWTNDKAGTSNCAAACLAIWPALEVTDASAPLTGGTGITGKLATTNDASGKPQVTYNSWPLYFYAKDKNAGDTTGQGVNGKWFVVTPDQAPPAS